MYSAILISFLFIVSFAQAEDTVYCTKDYCDNYPGVSDTPCPTLPPLCNETKSDSGIFLPSPTPCNCCDYCIGYLSEGDSCSTGEKTSDTPTEICGPGLFCDKTTEKCQQSSVTACLQAQVKYDKDKEEGKIGDFQIRPKCDENGDYVTYHCIPGGVCYCVDKNGKRIFGTIDNTGKSEFELPCSCSRSVNEMGIIIGRELGPGDHFRCSQNGAYEQLQCIDEKNCLCVDGIDGAPTYKNMAPVEIWAISNSSLPCFNSTINSKGKFYRRCEEIYINKTAEIKDKRDEYDEVLSYNLPSCSLDGRYALVQETADNKFCSTPSGLLMNNYILEKTDDTKDLRDSMNCKCALAESIMSSVEKPSCLSNGNYNPTQCRRGICFNVDEDGNQIIL